MPELIFLQDLAVVMAVSAVTTLLCSRLRLPVVLGYLVAGIIIGPHTPPTPLINDLHSIHTLSELGVIFLLFFIGLEFSLTKLFKVGLVSLVAAVVEILLMIWIGFTVGRAFGWSPMDSVFLGAMLSISSTTIIAKVLVDMKLLQERFAQVILGILVVEDLLGIVLIAILSGFASTGAVTLGAAGMAALQVIGFVAGVMFVGMLAVPPLLRYLQRFATSEQLVITVLGCCLGTAVLGVRLGFSAALGSFLVGAIVAETPQGHRIAHHMTSIREMFTAIFFVAVGMLIDPRLFVDLWAPIAVITVATILGKVLSCSLGAWLTGYEGNTALRIGLGLSQIGEFSFIIARLGQTSGLMSPFLYPIAVSVSGVTTLTTPLLIKQAPRIVHALRRLAPQPLKTFASLYHAWLKQLRSGGSDRQRAVWQGLRSYVPQLLLYTIGGFGLLGGALALPRWIDLSPVPHAALVLMLGGFVFVGLAFTIDRMLWGAVVKTWLAPAKDEGVLLHRALRFLLLVLSGFAMLALTALIVPGSMPVTLAILGLLLASGLALWGTMRQVHERIERLVLSVFDREQPLPKEQADVAREQLVELVRDEYAGEVETEDFLVPQEETGLNRTIGELRVRTETGASIVAIYREQEFIPNPPPSTRLAPGSVLLLMGRPEQIKRAFATLRAWARRPPPSPGAPSSDGGPIGSPPDPRSRG